MSFADKTETSSAGSVVPSAIEIRLYRTGFILTDGGLLWIGVFVPSFEATFSILSAIRPGKATAVLVFTEPNPFLLSPIVFTEPIPSVAFINRVTVTLNAFSIVTGFLLMEHCKNARSHSIALRFYRAIEFTDRPMRPCAYRPISFAYMSAVINRIEKRSIVYERGLFKVFFFNSFKLDEYSRLNSIFNEMQILH
jgi:hypothetical protein